MEQKTDWTMPLEEGRGYVLEVPDSYRCDGSLRWEGQPLRCPISVDREAKRMSFYVRGGGGPARIDYLRNISFPSPVHISLRPATPAEEATAREEEEADTGPEVIVYRIQQLADEWRIPADDIREKLAELGIPSDRERVRGDTEKILRSHFAAAISEAKRLRREELLEDLVRKYEHFGHYQDERFLKQYAASHIEELLDDEENIRTDFRLLHQDREFVELLKTGECDVCVKQQLSNRASCLGPRSWSRLS
jgi:hypothetical protein